VLDWLSQERSIIAAIIIIILLGSLTFSIILGVKQTASREKDEVFGDPERTLGGWYWTVTGVSTILLLWFYFS
jgi:taurine transport system permease protein